MLVWLILLMQGIITNHASIHQMQFRILSNTYFDTFATSLVLRQQISVRHRLNWFDCTRFCLDIGNSCYMAIYDSLNRTCSIYNTTMGIKRTSSCCTTYINRQTEEPISLPGITPVNSLSKNTSHVHNGRAGHTATLLSTGQVLIVGGFSDTEALSSCELYHPQNNSWTIAASMNTPRLKHTANKLIINNFELIFVIGGAYNFDLEPSNTIEYYNVSSDTWTMVPHNMTDARFSHTTTTLIDNRLLVTGGFLNGSALASTEIFDSSNSMWETVGSLNQGRTQHVDAILGNGNVFIAGGMDYVLYYIQSCEVFDINSQTWSYVRSTNYARNAGSIASLLDLTNSILLIGGQISGATNAELYNPTTDTMTTLSNMDVPRMALTSTMVYYQSTPLVVVVGGYDNSLNATNSVQVFLVSNSTWISVQGLSIRRGEHTATLFNSSPISILVVGGLMDGSKAGVLDSTEILIYN